MVELQIVILAVAGSSPVGHPPAAAPREIPNSKSQVPKSRTNSKASSGAQLVGTRDLGLGISAEGGGMCVA